MPVQYLVLGSIYACKAKIGVVYVMAKLMLKCGERSRNSSDSAELCFLYFLCETQVSDLWERE